MMMIELVKKLAGLLKLKDLFFENMEAHRLVAMDVPKEFNVEVNYSAEGRRRSERAFDAIATFVATMNGLDSPVARVACTIRVVFVLPDNEQTREVQLTDELVNALAETQGIYTAHPYFREYLHGASGRLALPPLLAPHLTGKSLFDRVRDREAKKAEVKPDVKATNVVSIKPSKAS